MSTVDIGIIEADYLAGLSTYDLERKYGHDHSVIAGWMRKRGHSPRTPGYYESHKNAAKQKHLIAKNNIDDWLNEHYGDEYTLLEYTKWHVPCKLRHNTCGGEFTREVPNIKKRGINCPVCKERQLEKNRADKEAEKAKRIAERTEELSKDKICNHCGSVFHSELKRKKYCSEKCKRRARDKRRNRASSNLCINHRRRARKYGVAYEPGISLEKLIERDGLTCRICGGECDLSDRNGKLIGNNYPTIDHIVAMKNGGGHTWDNVQIAHRICNSYKRDLTELTDEVISHAKEQTAANK